MIVSHSTGGDRLRWRWSIPVRWYRRNQNDIRATRRDLAECGTGVRHIGVFVGGNAALALALCGPSAGRSAILRGLSARTIALARSDSYLSLPQLGERKSVSGRR